MSRFHHKKNIPVLIWSIALAVLLRSFIAPGFMLSVSASDGLGIIFCNGPGGIYAKHNPGTGHHQHHGGGGTEHQNHISPTCSFWSTSSLLVVAARIESVAIITTLAERPAHHRFELLQQFLETSRVTRGPPALS